MRYIAYGSESATTPHLLWGTRAVAGTVLALSHEPGGRLLEPEHGDTHAETALLLARSGRLAELEHVTPGVTSDHFDADRLLAVWVCQEPEAALLRADAVIAAARAGIYGVYERDEAAQFACWVRSILDEQRPVDDDAAFQVTLPLVQAVLDSPREHDLTWIGEYSDVIVSKSMLNSGAVQFDHYDDLGLTVMHTPIDLHDLVRLSAVSTPRLLTVRSENTYVFEYRRESWVRRRTPAPPRVHLSSFASRLNLFERNEGRWRADPIDAPVSRLYLDGGLGRFAPSSIDVEVVIEELLDYLRAAATIPDMCWSPHDLTGGPNEPA